MWILPEQKNGFFDDTQKDQITVLFNTIQPGDTKRKVPNAQEAGAVEFLHLLLARDASVFADITAWKSLYTNSLIALDEQAQIKYTKPLHTLTTEECAFLITGLETNSLVSFQYNNVPINQPALFDTLRRHCIQGCFADPVWGGNKNKIMWRWYGYQEETKEISK